MLARRKFLKLMGVSSAVAPLAAKAAVEANIAQSMGGVSLNGLGNASLGLPGGQPEISAHVSYEKRLIGAADYLKMFGLPASVETGFRDQARYVGSLDSDIACKKSWSMSVKIMTQRERNYQRLVERVKVAGLQERGRQQLKSLMGFDWPW